MQNEVRPARMIYPHADTQVRDLTVYRHENAGTGNRIVQRGEGSVHGQQIPACERRQVALDLD